jgi:hypothetical protein
MTFKYKLNLQQFGQNQQGLFATTRLNKNGVMLDIDIRNTGGNWNLGTDEISRMIDKIIANGGPLSDEQLAVYIVGGTDRAGKLANVRAAQNQIINQNKDYFGFQIDTTTGEQISLSQGLTAPTGADGQVSAFNEYYRDLYSMEPGTGGAEMLGRLEQSYANQAQQAATMADVGFQQAALQQASTVKAITDQVRSERMARLRAGMSESQIANQDMQMLMANVNTLNQNAAMLNDQRLQAQIGMNTAQDQAYMDFLNQANARGQIATGMAASDAGDAYQQTIRQMTTLYGNDPTRWTAQQWSTVSNQVTGQNQTK